MSVGSLLLVGGAVKHEEHHVTNNKLWAVVVPKVDDNQANFKTSYGYLLHCWIRRRYTYCRMEFVIELWKAHGYASESARTTLAKSGRVVLGYWSK